MDKEQARFILQSFRPDGADAKDPDFAEALARAAEDRELGDWLALERVQDASFSAAFNNLEIPDELRENILSIRNEELVESDLSEMDAAIMGALASVRPPEELRAQIVTAMKVETASEPVAGAFTPEETSALKVEENDARTATGRAQSWMRSAAVAAALVLGAFVAFEMTDDEKPAPDGITLSALEHSSIQHVSSESALQHEGTDIDDLNTFFVSKELPTIREEDLPPGLTAVDSKPVGCALLNLGKKNASLVCFNKDGEVVHLVVVRRADLEKTKIAALEELKAGKGSCWQCPATNISVATWAEGDRAFVLLSESKPEEMRKKLF